MIQAAAQRHGPDVFLDIPVFAGEIRQRGRVTVNDGIEVLVQNTADIPGEGLTGTGVVEVSRFYQQTVINTYKATTGSAQAGLR